MMKKSLTVPGLTREETEARIGELVPMALELLRNILVNELKDDEILLRKRPGSRNKQIADKPRREYGRFHLEAVKTVFGAAGIGKADTGKAKDVARMTAAELMKSVSQAKVIAHDPPLVEAKSLIDDD